VNCTRWWRHSRLFSVNVFVTPSSRIGVLLLNKQDFLKEHLQACRDLNHGRVNVNLILVNYWGIGDDVEVVHELNDAL
jgi:hypothetical protein